MKEYSMYKQKKMKVRTVKLGDKELFGHSEIVP